MSEETTSSAEEAGTSPGSLFDGPAFESMLGDVPLEMTVELGRIKLPLAEVIDRLGPGSIIPLTKLTGEHLDVLVNGRPVAKAEAVAIGDRYGIRIVNVATRGNGEQS
jgi:flagellar motor switch protein FliN/FliY